MFILLRNKHIHLAIIKTRSDRGNGCTPLFYEIKELYYIAQKDTYHTALFFILHMEFVYL